jgi:hypothetical protein
MRFTFVCCIALVSGAAGSGLALASDAELARGAALLAPLKSDLKQALVAGLEKGPAHAIDVCRDQAPAIAHALSVNGVKVGRTSHRLRNPANSAPEWVEPILETYRADDAGQEPRLVSLGKDRLGYVEPIRLQPMCLACHGNVLTSEVTARLKHSYPGDQATGFEVGDLRGVYWVEFPYQQ